MAVTSQEAAAKSPFKEASIGVVVIKCRCNDPWNIHLCKCTTSERILHQGSPCPNGNEPCPVGLKQNHGIVSYWHKNPFKRFAYWFKTKILKEIYE